MVFLYNLIIIAIVLTVFVVLIVGWILDERGKKWTYRRCLDILDEINKSLPPFGGTYPPRPPVRR